MNWKLLRYFNDWSNGTANGKHWSVVLQSLPICLPILGLCWHLTSCSCFTCFSILFARCFCCTSRQTIILAANRWELSTLQFEVRISNSIGARSRFMFAIWPHRAVLRVFSSWTKFTTTKNPHLFLIDSNPSNWSISCSNQATRSCIWKAALGTPITPLVN